MTRTSGYPLPASWADRVLTADDMPALHKALRETIGGLGLMMPSYGLVLMPEARLLHEATLITYPPDWERHYMAQGYFRDDPAVVAGLRRRGAFAWREVPLPETPRAGRIMAEAADFGIRDGLTVPMWGGPLTGLCSALPDATTPERRGAILETARTPFITLALLVNERARQIYHYGAATDLLTPRERECVRWLATGKTGAEIADILHISGLTVNQHLKSAMRKLEASTRAQLAVRAVALGLADPG